MTRRRAAVVALIGANAAVIIGPAVVIAGAARKGGLPWAHGLDLLAVSAAIAVVHCALVRRRLRRHAGNASAFLDACVAGVDALVVLALLGTAVVFVGLGGLAPQHAAVLNNGWHVAVVWALLQSLAVVAATAVRHGMFAWLRRAGRGATMDERRRLPAHSGHPPVTR